MKAPESGSATVFVATLTVALVAVAGLVVDGGLLLAGRTAALDEADAAARAGAEAVDVDLLQRDGVALVDPEAARARVAAYLSRTGHQGDVAVDGDAVTVVVRVPVRLTILGLFGVGPKVVRASGSAHGVTGVEAAP